MSSITLQYAKAMLGLARQNNLRPPFEWYATRMFAEACAREGVRTGAVTVKPEPLLLGWPIFEAKSADGVQAMLAEAEGLKDRRIVTLRTSGVVEVSRYVEPLTEDDWSVSREKMRAFEMTWSLRMTQANEDFWASWMNINP